MPVYNEAAFIAESLSSLQNQTYPNLRIVVSDNASTDGTETIAKEIAQSESRLDVVSRPNNIGAAANFALAAAEVETDYFMWAAGHDLWSPDLVSSCVAALEAKPSAVIAYGACEWIDETGAVIDRYTGFGDTSDRAPLERFFTTLWGNMHPVLGVIRQSALRRAKPFLPIPGADLVLLSELSLMGEFLYVPEVTWHRRLNRPKETHGQRLARYSSDEYALSRQGIAPFLRLPIELIRVAATAPLPLTQRIAAVLAVTAAFPARYLAGKQRANES